LLRYGSGLDSPLAPATVPILLELHRLDGSPRSLRQHLVDALARSGFPRADAFVDRALNAGELLLLFDGLDEVGTNERPRVARAIRDLLNRYQDCHAVFTCRNAVYQHEFDAVADRSLEIVEFSDRQIRSFLSAWEPDMPAHKSKDQLVHTLYDRPRIMALARNPLLLSIIAYLYTDTEYVLPHSRAEFYQRATDLLLDHWHRERNRYQARDKALILQHLALFNQTRRSGGGEDGHSIDYRGILAEIGHLLPDLNLDPDEDARPLLDEIVERSGLLLAIDGGARYQFAHLTLQEFFAANALRQDPGRLLASFGDDADAWREPIKLWCGLAEDSTAVIDAIHQRFPVIAFEALADARKLEPRLAEQIIEGFEQRLIAGKADEDALRAFAAVASDQRPRGREVFAFLQRVLAADGDERARTDAARALSLSNLPQAAEALGGHYGESADLRSALLRMGELAVPVLAARATAGGLDAVTDLAGIGTPGAARVLAPLLWSDQAPDALSSVAALSLMGMLTDHEVEQALRRFPLSAQQRAAESLAWVWEPFDEPDGSALPIIAGRIAWVIRSMDALGDESGEWLDGIEGPERLDKRLVLPLVATHMPPPLVAMLEIVVHRPEYPAPVV
jgi:hypothetical protein